MDICQFCNRFVIQVKNRGRGGQWRALGQVSRVSSTFSAFKGLAVATENLLLCDQVFTCRPTAGHGGGVVPSSRHGHVIFHFVGTVIHRAQQPQASALPPLLQGFPVQPLADTGSARHPVCSRNILHHASSPSLIFCRLSVFPLVIPASQMVHTTVRVCALVCRLYRGVSSGLVVCFPDKAQCAGPSLDMQLVFQFHFSVMSSFTPRYFTYMRMSGRSFMYIRVDRPVQNPRCNIA